VFWPSTISLIDLANKYNAELTLQFNPQWAEYILNEEGHANKIREWQKKGHEVGLHHHGYEHGDWNGYTNRPGKEDDPRFRGTTKDLIEIMVQLVGPYQLFTGTISDEKFDYPEGLRYDTEGIRVEHAKSKPKCVTLGGKKVIQVGMAFLSFEGDIESFKREYLRSNENEIFGVVTHEKDFFKNPEIIEEWFQFIISGGKTITSVSKIITDYQRAYTIGHSKNPLTFLKDVTDSND